MTEEADQEFEKKIVKAKTLNPEIIITESFSEWVSTAKNIKI